MALPLPSSSPAPGIDGSKADSKPCDRDGKKEGEIFGITKPVLPPDGHEKYENVFISRIRDYFPGLAEMVTGAPAEPCFLLDSGASLHMTGKFELLDDFIPDSSAKLLEVRDGRHLRSEGVGSLACHGISIRNVNYVPGLAPGYTLVSVQQLAGCGYLVLFGGGRCYVKNRKDGSLVGKGRLHQEDGCYHLEFLQILLDAHQGSN